MSEVTVRICWGPHDSPVPIHPNSPMCAACLSGLPRRTMRRLLRSYRYIGGGEAAYGLEYRLAVEEVKVYWRDRTSRLITP